MSKTRTLFLLLLALLAILTTGSIASPIPNTQLQKGVFLIATKNLSKSSFEKTVILITKYSKYGAMGLVINRPTNFKIADIFPTLKSAKAQNTLYLGGPVHPKSVVMLIGSTKSYNIPAIIDGVYLQGGHRTLKQFMEPQEPNEDIIQAYAGYSGWAPGQLEAEIGRGDWLITKADKSSIFEANSADLWQQLIKAWSGQWI